MSGYKQLPIPDMDTWSVDQMLAVYDLCQTISAELMLRHEPQLLEKMAEIDQRHGVGRQQTELNLQLPFDDSPS